MGEERLQGGRLLVAVSNAVITLFRDFSGKGPQSCNAHWAGDDLLVILLEGGYTVAEQTLYDAGHGRAVRDSRQMLQDSLEVRMTAIVEDLTKRRVRAFMSTSHQSPDLSVELFLLEPA